MDRRPCTLRPSQDTLRRREHDAPARDQCQQAQAPLKKPSAAKHAWNSPWVDRQRAQRASTSGVANRSCSVLALTLL